MNGKHLIAFISIIFVTTIIINIQKASERSQFQFWKDHHGIKYNSEMQNAYRERIYNKNKDRINQHNSNKQRTYDMGVNQFTSMTNQEFELIYLRTFARSSINDISNKDEMLIGDVDWEAQGVVTRVKNQGDCGSCWAFSAVAALQSLNKLSYGSLINFSEQQLMDCSGQYGNAGCLGGLMNNAFEYVIDHGIEVEEKYPYKGQDESCYEAEGSFKISRFTSIDNCNDLANALTGRPISVAVDATNWNLYKSGIFNNCKANLNHGVALVGISNQYWKIKNSWGKDWGEEGYIRLSRGNTCGICNAGSYPSQ